MRKQLEIKFTNLLQKWMKYNMKFSFAWEVKVVDKGKKLYYNQKSFLKERRNLLLCGRYFIHKFSDIARFGTPFDGIKLSGVAGFVFVQYHSRAIKTFYVIEISDIEREIESGSKGLTEERAKEIGKTYKLK